jgi:methionine-rich copper-binding protein CopC
MKYLFVLFTLFGLANAHSYLKTSIPAEGDTLTTLAPIELTFTEKAEVKFSFFKVYKLADTGDLSDNTERLRLNGQASTLVNDVLPKRNDEAERANTEVIAEGDTSSTIALPLKEDLTPGIYVVMWRVLSVDTHTTQGFFLFEYAP